MASKKDELIGINLPAFRSGIKDLGALLAGAGKVYEEAAGAATAQFGEHILGEAGERAPLGDGGLRESGTVEGPVIEGKNYIVFVAFNIVYARMRDIGGTIKPVRAKMLFIPLRPGARPGDPTLVYGVDFVLARKVVQHGNRYWSATLDELVPRSTELIGKQAIVIAEKKLEGLKGGGA